MIFSRFLLPLASFAALAVSLPALAEPAPGAEKSGKGAAVEKVAPEKTEAVKNAAGAAKAKNPKDYVIAKVNGDNLYFSEVEDLWNAFFAGGKAPEFDSFDEKVKQQIVRELVSKKLFYAQALKDNVDKTPEYMKQFEAARRQLAIQLYVQNKTKGLLSEEKVKDAYNKKAAEMRDKEEVHARHILLSSEDAAKDIIKKIKDGADFAQLAKEKSEDKGSGASGGDLGYFTEDKMVPEFAKAVFALKKGEVTQEPVKSDFGFHVIKVEDRRKMQVPPLAEMRDQIESDIVNNEVTKILNGLIEKADVQYFGRDGKPKEFVKNPKATTAEKSDKSAKDTKDAATAKDAGNPDGVDVDAAPAAGEKKTDGKDGKKGE